MKRTPKSIAVRKTADQHPLPFVLSLGVVLGLVAILIAWFVATN